MSVNDTEDRWVVCIEYVLGPFTLAAARERLVEISRDIFACSCDHHIVESGTRPEPSFPPDGSKTFPPIPWDYLQENLVTQADIARRLRITRTAATSWQQYTDWPAPVMTFAAHSSTGESGFYWWPDIQAFLGRHNYRGRMPRPGRPRNTARDEKIIARAGAGEEPASIAADLGLTPERVRKIVRKAR